MDRNCMTCKNRKEDTRYGPYLVCCFEDTVITDPTLECEAWDGIEEGGAE